MDALNNMFVNLHNLIARLLSNVLPDPLVTVIMSIIAISVVLGLYTVVVLSQIYLERRGIARVQDRRGPNRAGPFGLLQPIADTIKLLAKDDIIPCRVDPLVFKLAPVVTLVPAVLALAVLPFSDKMIISDLNIGVLFLVAIGSVGTVGVVMGGWGSNNKYSLLGAMRSAAVMVSYEIPMVLSFIGVVMLAGSLSTVSIVKSQPGLADTIPFFGYIVLQPLAFIVYFIAAVAELNRTPFDIAEGESEIVAGYHTEYSGMRFALFFLAELFSAFTVSAVAATVFFGGWRGPVLPPYIWFMIKAYAIYFILIWLRGTLPRLRIDQLLNFAWKFLIPLAFVNIFLTAVGLLVYQQYFAR